MPTIFTNVSSTYTNQNQGGGSKKAGLVPTETASVVTAMAYRIRGLPKQLSNTLQRGNSKTKARSRNKMKVTKEEIEKAPVVEEEEIEEGSVVEEDVPLFSTIKQSISIDYTEGTEEYDWFGWSVSISGNRAIIGAPLKDESGLTNAGAVYIYEYDTDSDTWIQMQKLVETTALIKFGVSVAIMDDYAVIGCGGSFTLNTGEAYIFKYHNNEWQRTIGGLKQSGNSGERYGSAVDIYGDNVIVGAFNPSNIGFVDIWTSDGDNWTSTRISGGETNDYFGYTVSISEKYAIVGAYLGKKAYIYKRESGVWNTTPLHTLTNPKVMFSIQKRPGIHVLRGLYL